MDYEPTTTDSATARLSFFTGKWLRLLGSMVSPSGARARLMVLIYHRVLSEPDPLRPGEVIEEQFRGQMQALADCCTVLPLGQALTRLQEESLPRRAVAVTFDDGYLDNHDRALPILSALGLPATFFISTGSLGRCMWNDKVLEWVRVSPGPTLDARELGLDRLPLAGAAARTDTAERLLTELKTWHWHARDTAIDNLLDRTGIAHPQGLMMQEREIRALADAGMEIGAHTVHHPILSRLPDAEAREEIDNSRTALEAITGRPVDLFAYPNGRPGIDYTDDHVRMVRELGFRGAVSTARGPNRTRHCDVHQLLRFTPWDRTPARFVARLIHACI